MFELQKNTQFSTQEISADGNVVMKFLSPISVLVNEFTEQSAKEFEKEMFKAQNTGQKIIPILIDSYGGEVYSLLKMVDVIKSSPIPVATICVGKAMSCGSVLLSCGMEGHRYMAPTATVMIHEVSSVSFGKVEEIKASSKETERLNQTIFKMMANNCGKDSEHFIKLMHERGHADWFLDSEEVKKNNLVNHIRIPRMKVSFSAELKFE